MKRTALCLLVIGSMLVGASPAWAKWVLAARSSIGTWFVSDRVVKVQGDCKIVLVGLIFKKPKMSRTQGRKILAQKYTARICCRARNYQLLRFVLVDVNKKSFYARRLTGPAKPLRPGSVMASIARRVCAPGFGPKPPAAGPKPPAAGPKPPPTGAKSPATGAKPAPTGAKPAAADSYKKTCKYCSNSGGIWLCCTCKTNSGANKRSCLDPRKCQGRGISNCNGTLTCGQCK